jgi:heme O synthase-like polyprenyltransferase
VFELGNLEPNFLPMVEKCLFRMSGISLGFLIISFLIGHLNAVIVVLSLAIYQVVYTLPRFSHIGKIVIEIFVEIRFFANSC